MEGITHITNMVWQYGVLKGSGAATDTEKNYLRKEKGAWNEYPVWGAEKEMGKTADSQHLTGVSLETGNL